MKLGKLMFHLNIAEEAKFTKLSYVSTSNRKPPPAPRPPSQVLFGVLLLMLSAGI